MRALRATFDRLGGQPAGLALHCTNRIPQSRGLGSSSAAIVAAVVAARALVEGGDELLDAQAALALADALEGHPDNVAACLHGGVTFAWTTPDGPRVVRLDACRRPRARGLRARHAAPRRRRSAACCRRPCRTPTPSLNAGRAALLPLALTRDP